MKTSFCATLLVLLGLAAFRTAAIPVMTSPFRSMLRDFERASAFLFLSSVDSNEFRRLMDDDHRQLGIEQFDVPRKHCALLRLAHLIDHDF